MTVSYKIKNMRTRTKIYRIGDETMRKSIALKTLLRSPLKTLLTFLLITAASFALFSRVTDYAVTTRETKNAESFYHAVAYLDNSVRDMFVETAYVNSADGTVSTGYGVFYKMEEKPWPTMEEIEEFRSLPGVTLVNKSYTTAGLVEDYERLVGKGDYGGHVIFEGTYTGYMDDSNPSVLEDHVRLKFENVKVIACDGGPEIESSFTMEDCPLGDTYYAKSPYTRAFYDSLEKGSRCLVLAINSGYQYGSLDRSGIQFLPQDWGEGALCVIDGQPDNYLETEEFARQKGWVDAINHNCSVYDIEYTTDMRALWSINTQKMLISKGRCLTAEDTDACVVSADFLEEHGLSIGDSISVQLGNQIYNGGSATAVTISEEDYAEMLDAGKIPEYIDTVDVTIVGAYEDADKDAVYAISPNTIYMPVSLLPVEVPEDAGGGMIFIENARDIEAFHEGAEQFAQKVGLELSFSDRGWLDVKDSFRMGALTSLLTTMLYIAGAVLALFLAVYLYIGRNKKSYAIMRTLGVPGKTAGNSVVLPFVIVSVIAMPLGGITGLYYAQDIATKTLVRMADSAPIGYVPDAEIPISVIILCLLSELLFVSFVSYFFLRNMKKTPPLELLQEGSAQAKAAMKARSVIPQEETTLEKLDIAKLSAAGESLPQGNYGAIRHVASYIRNHMRRGIGKTAVSLILAVVLAAGIGTLVLAKVTYQNAFYKLDIKGTASDFIFTYVVDLSKSPLVKDFYCYKNFGVRIQGTDDNIPMTITNDLTRNMGNDCTVDYAEGFDISAFEGTAQVCLIGKELAKELGVSPGDEIGMLSDILYAMLEESGAGDNAVSGYKMYKVIGVVESGDANINKGVFTGIRSDLQRLFSMDFPMDHCEFTLTNNEKLDELDALLTEKRDGSFIYASTASYHLDTGGLENIKRIRALLESLFPIAVAAAVLIGIFGPLLVILQSAQEAAFLRILGVTKKRARCMLVFEQVILCIAGIILVAGGIALYSRGLFAKSIETLAFCWMLYLLGGICGATVAAVQVTRHKVLELLQVRE